MNDELQPLVPERESQNAMLVPAAPPDHFWTATMLHSQMHRYGTVLRKRWWILLLSFLFIGGPAIIYAVIKPPTFSSQAMMWLNGKLNLPDQEVSFSEELDNYIGTQAELLKSPAIQNRAFQKVRSAFPEIAASVTNAQPEGIPFALTVKSLTKSSVLGIEAKGRSADATRAYLDAVMDEYLALKKSSRQQTSVGALAGITDQVEQVKRQIQQQQEALTVFGMSNSISYLTEHGLTAGSHLSKLDEDLSDLRTEYRLLELLTPEQVSDLSTGNQNTFSETALPGEKAAGAVAASMQPSETAYYQALQQLLLLKATRDDFARVLRPTHSKMVKLNQEIAGLEQVLKTLQDDGEQRALAHMTNRKKALGLQIESLETQYRTWETNADAASQKLAEYDRKKQDLQRSQALYDRLLGLMQTVDLNQNVDQDPLVPLAPASPARQTLLGKLMIVAGGLFLAFVTGTGLLLLLEAFDDRFTSVNEISCHVPEQVIGQIPESRLNRRNGARFLLRHPEEQHTFNESFRDLSSHLFFMFEEAARPRIILLTSAVPKEGKSTVAAHFASSLATSGSRVLLIDADLRRSSLDQLFGVSSKPGLHEVLNHAVPVADAIIAVSARLKGWGQRNHEIQTPDNAAETSSLFLLPAGTRASDSSELFLHGQMHGLLRDLAKQFSYIIIDSPPVLATNDAISLSSEADGVLMVVRASSTSSRMLREALDRMHRRKVNVIGIVYNRAAPSTDYYYRYGRDYASK